MFHEDTNGKQSERYTKYLIGQAGASCFWRDVMWPDLWRYADKWRSNQTWSSMCTAMKLDRTSISLILYVY